MKEHMDKIEFLLQRYDYEQLSAQEQHLVQEILGSEEAYRLMRTSINQARGSQTDLKSGAAMKQELMTEFKKQHGRAGAHTSGSLLGRLFQRQVPAYVMVILLLVAVAPYFFWGTGAPDQQASEVTYVEVPTIADTVYVTLAADTVYQERLVYQKVFVKASPTPDELQQKQQATFVSSDVNTSLADNEALTALTVSID